MGLQVLHIHDLERETIKILGRLKTHLVFRRPYILADIQFSLIAAKFSG